MTGLKTPGKPRCRRGEGLLEAHFTSTSEWRLAGQDSISTAQLDDKAGPATAATVSPSPQSGAELWPLSIHIWGNARQRRRVRRVRDE
jgi:hypothetical protein